MRLFSSYLNIHIFNSFIHTDIYFKFPGFNILNMHILFKSFLISGNDQFLIMLCLCYCGLALLQLALSNVTCIYHRLGGGRKCTQLPGKWTGHRVEAAKSGAKLRCRIRFFVLQNLNDLANVHCSSSSSETKIQKYPTNAP